jgi:2-keto-3-deoxy-L-fuconate dehydrogenase
MKNRLEGKSVFVTGAGQGIGRAISLHFASLGARVIASDMNADTLNAYDEHSDITGWQLNVTDQDAIRAAAQEFQNVNVLVNCCGVVKNGSILDCSDDDFELSWNVNTRAIFHTIRAFLPNMLASGGGSIINIASIVSSLKGANDRFAYGVSKAGVLGLTKSVAIDFIEQGIRCNAICPGTVDTPSLQQRLEDTGDYDKAREAFINRQAMKRLGSAEEIAAAAAMLASDESAFMTGTELIIDGGWSL